MRRRALLAGAVTLPLLPTAAALQPDVLLPNWSAILAACPDRAIAEDPARYRLQIGLTRIDGTALRHRHFRLDRREWQTPASLVKLPLAIMALERLAALRRAGQAVDLDTPLRLSGAPDCTVWGRNPEPLRRTLTALFAVSDNAAYNRLYDWLGPAAIHARFADWGITDARLWSRFAACSPESHRIGADWAFLDAAGRERASGRADPPYAPAAHPLGHPRFGSAWMEAGRRIDGPVDFSERNHLPLADVHEILLRLVAPEAFPASKRYALDPSDRQALLQLMTLTPPESRDPVYAESDYPSHYNRYLFVGEGARPRPAGLTLAGKVGEAYGFLSDSVYASERGAAGLRFVLSAALYVNADDVLNDGGYEYATQGRPFLAWLGHAVLAALRGQPLPR
jgi:hypothetical protein